MSEECTSDETLSDGSPLTYWKWLLDQGQSPLDMIDKDDLLNRLDIDNILEKQKPSKPNPRPYIAFNDLNNSDDAPNENKPRPAIEIGIAFDF